MPDQAEAHTDEILSRFKSRGGKPESEAKLRDVRRILYRGPEG